MDNRLLFGRSRRKQWPHKTSSVVKLNVMSGDLLKADHMNMFQEKHTDLTTWIYFSSTIECFHGHFASYSAYEILGNWIAVMLYAPFDARQSTFGIEEQAIISPPSLLKMIVLSAAVYFLIHCTVQHFLEEYRTFIALGKGGTPCTPMGMIKVTILGYFANVDVFHPPHMDPMLKPSKGKLYDIPRRSGSRPIVKGVAPQRQFNQKSTVATFNKLSQILKNAAAKDQDLKIATSYLEGHTDALRGVSADRPHEVLGTDGEWDYEIAHPHRIDSSVHVICHPEDCKTIIEAGWGEKHPLSTDAHWWRYIHHNICRKRLPVPPNLVLVYAPRNPAELRIVESFIDAAIWFYKERDMCDKINKRGLVKGDACCTDISRVRNLDNKMYLPDPNDQVNAFEGISSEGIGRSSLLGTEPASTCTLTASLPLPAVPLTKSCA